MRAAHELSSAPLPAPLVPHADPAAVGGIYSVLKSKAQVTTAEYGAAYTLLGPWNRASVCAIAQKLPELSR